MSMLVEPGQVITTSLKKGNFKYEILCSPSQEYFYTFGEGIQDKEYKSRLLHVTALELLERNCNRDDIAIMANRITQVNDKAVVHTKLIETYLKDKEWGNARNIFDNMEAEEIVVVEELLSKEVTVLREKNCYGSLNENEELAYNLKSEKVAVIEKLLNKEVIGLREKNHNRSMKEAEDIAYKPLQKAIKIREKTCGVIKRIKSFLKDKMGKCLICCNPSVSD